MSAYVFTCTCVWSIYLLLGAGVLNSLSMCDESSGWEKPLLASGERNPKEAINLSRSQFIFLLLADVTILSVCLPLPQCSSLYVLGQL